MTNISNAFISAAQAANKKRNVLLKAELAAVDRKLSVRPAQVSAYEVSEFSEITSREILGRTDQICETLFRLTGDVQGSISPEDAVALRQLTLTWLRQSMQEIRNELFARAFVQSPPLGRGNDAIQGWLALEFERAEGAAFGDAEQKLEHRLSLLARPNAAPPSSEAAGQLPPGTFTVIVDTNCFLQLDDLEKQPWTTVLPTAKHVEIAVAKVVVEELDKHKASNVSRLRDRSRRALKKIDEAALLPGRTMVLREASPRVTLKLLAKNMPKWDDYPELDRANNDDRLVGALIANAPDSTFRLLSFDSGPRLTAAHHDLASLVLEARDEWRLKDLPDAAEQENKRLRKELEEARKTSPEIELDVPAEYVLDIPVVEPLDPTAVDILVRGYLAGNPRLQLEPTEFSMMMIASGNARGITHFDIERYNAKYEEFVVSTREYFEDLHTAVAASARIHRIPVHLKNLTPVTAHNLLLTYRVDAVGMLFDDDDAAAQYMTLPPEPPEDPRRTSGGPGNDMIRQAWELTSFNRPKEMTAFYYTRPHKTERRSEGLQCIEFRARETFSTELLVMPILTAPGTYDIHFKVSATNLPAPIERTCTIRFNEALASWNGSDAVDYLPEQVQALFRRELGQAAI